MSLKLVYEDSPALNSVRCLEHIQDCSLLIKSIMDPCCEIPHKRTHSAVYSYDRINTCLLKTCVGSVKQVTSSRDTVGKTGALETQ